jgi:hypothetical protein
LSAVRVSLAGVLAALIVALAGGGAAVPRGAPPPARAVEAAGRPASGTEPALVTVPETGPCDGEVEIRGADLPAGVRRVQAGLLGIGRSDVPSVNLGGADTDDGGAFRARVVLGADGCRLAQAPRPAGGTGPRRIAVAVYDATALPFSFLGVVLYTPTTGVASGEGGDYHNPAWPQPVAGP